MFFIFGKMAYLNQWMAGITVSMAALITGLANGWTSPYLAQLTTVNITLPLHLTEAEASWVASTLSFGRFVGVILGSIAQGVIGRKRTILIASAPLACGWICIWLATSVKWLYPARILCGTASGMMWSALSLYLGEIADPMIRGSLIFVCMNTAAMGAFLGNTMGPYITMETYSYVTLTGIGIFVVLFSFIPESPYHYIVHGNIPKAEESLKWFKREDDVKNDIQELQDFVGCTRVSFSRRFNEFVKPMHLKNTIHMFFLNIFLYFAGHNTMSFYAEIIITKTEVSFTPSTVVIGFGICTIIASITATLVVDKFGRRLLLICSGIGTALAVLLLGLHFHMLSLGYDGKKITWLPIFSILLYNVSVAYGLVPVPCALVGELFPPILKTLESMLFSSGSALLSFGTSKAFQPFVDLVGEKYVFWSFAVSAASSATYTYFFIPETKGKSLVEIQESLKSKNKQTTVVERKDC